jgi:hypothetical protein
MMINPLTDLSKLADIDIVKLLVQIMIGCYCLGPVKV